ncbi:hypothetical protein ACA910_002814 [Epithemia clementina (nom. ined.)]
MKSNNRQNLLVGGHPALIYGPNGEQIHDDGNNNVAHEPYSRTSRAATLHHPTRLLLQSPLFLEHVSNRPPAMWTVMAQAFAAPSTGLSLLSFQLESTSLNIVGCPMGQVLVAIPFVQPLPLPALMEDDHKLMMDLVIDNTPT